MKDKLIAKIDACDAALEDVEKARKACLEAINKCVKVFESADNAISKAHEDHDAPEGFFASDPVGDTLGELDAEGLGTDLIRSEAKSFLDGKVWDNEWRSTVKAFLRDSRKIAGKLP
jgi:hypothetical protein